MVENFCEVPHQQDSTGYMPLGVPGKRGYVGREVLHLWTTAELPREGWETVQAGGA